MSSWAERSGVEGILSFWRRSLKNPIGSASFYGILRSLRSSGWHCRGRSLCLPAGGGWNPAPTKMTDNLFGTSRTPSPTRSNELHYATWCAKIKATTHLSHAERVLAKQTNVRFAKKEVQSVSQAKHRQVALRLKSSCTDIATPSIMAADATHLRRSPTDSGSLLWPNAILPGVKMLACKGIFTTPSIAHCSRSDCKRIFNAQNSCEAIIR